jgi:hypothetical protein
MVVIAHFHEVEAGLLGQHGLADDLLGAERLSGQLVADLHDDSSRNRARRFPWRKMMARSAQLWSKG